MSVLDSLFDPDKNTRILNYTIRVEDYLTNHYCADTASDTKPSSDSSGIRYSTREPVSPEVMIATLRDLLSAEELDRLISELNQPSSPTFSEQLFQIIRKQGKRDSWVYHGAHLDRRLFSKLRSPDYQPSRDTAIALCVYLQQSPDEAANLLKLAGYSLSPSCRRDVIIEYFLHNHLTNVGHLNEVLDAMGEKPLGR